MTNRGEEQKFWDEKKLQRGSQERCFKGFLQRTADGGH